MTQLKTLVLAAVAALAIAPSAGLAQTTSTPSQDTSATPVEPLSINQGNWEIGGEGNYFQSNDGKYHEINLSPKLEYFFLNRFSAGGRVVFSDTSLTSSALSFGPSLTWYFAHADRVATYIDQSILYVNPAGSGDNYFAGETGVGFDYFVRPGIAIGPSLRGIYYFSGDTEKPEGGLGVRLTLSVFI